MLFYVVTNSNLHISDIDRSCRIVVYAIDASNIENVTIEKIGRLPLERSKRIYEKPDMNVLNIKLNLDTPLPLLLVPLKFQPEAFLLVTVCLLLLLFLLLLLKLKLIFRSNKYAY